MPKVKSPPVSKILSAKGIPHKVFVHPGPLNSLQQAAEERGQQPRQIVRSILFRVTKDEYLMVLIAGPKQINWKTLRRHVGSNRLTMASNEEVLSVTGYHIGAVNPFGLPLPIRILIDCSVSESQVISIGSGVRGTAIIMKSVDLLTALGEYELGNFN